MLTGRPPFPGGTPLQKLLSHQGDAPPALAELRPDIPPALGAVVGRMLAKQPEQRYQTPADLTTALLKLSDQLGVVRPGLATTLVPALPKRTTFLERNLPWIAPVVLLIGGVLAMALFWQPDEPSTNFEDSPLTTPDLPGAGDLENRGEDAL